MALRYRLRHLGWIWGCSLLASIGLSATVASATFELPDALVWMAPEIDNCVHQVNNIRVHARITLVLALAVGLLGIAISAMQAWSAPIAKTVVFFMGIAVSALTLISDQVYRGVTHHTLYERCTTGDKLVSDIHKTIRRSRGITEAEQGLTGLQQVLEGHLSKCDTLNANGQQAAAWPFRIARAAFAGVEDASRGGPTWLDGRRPTENVIYFVGVAHGRDAAIGRDEALQNARDGIRNYLESELAGTGMAGTDVSPEVAARLASGAGVIDTYSTFDRSSGFVSSYALLGLDRRQLRRALVGSASMNNLAVNVDSVGQLGGPSPAYEASRQRAYACILDQGRQTMSSNTYEAFVAAREQRKLADQSTREYGPALSAMRLVTEQHPECYLCWYNLALIYQRTKAPAEAAKAFERAIALEPALGCRDASIYATYGRLLIDEGRFEAALPVLDRAAAYEQQHPYVRQLIARAQAGLAEPAEAQTASDPVSATDN